MTPERMTAIMDKVMQKYLNKPLTGSMNETIYRDLSAVMRGLYKQENFLGSVRVDLNKKVITVSNPEDLGYLGFVPYLVPQLMTDQSLFLTYYVEDNVARLMCGLIFKDVYDPRLPCCDVGFDVQTKNIHTLGIYYPDTDEFRRL